MGLLKKIFKPVSKVLDKIVPNEIKPFLPYAAAFAPYMLPAGLSFGTGIMSNPMIARAVASGGANLFSQLAQEGNEGDVNALSLGLGALQGAMGAENAASTLRSWKNPGDAISIPGGNVPGQTLGGFNYDASKLGFLDKAKNFGLEGLAKGSEFIGEAGSILRPGETPMTMKNVIQAAGIPFSVGTGEAMRYEADAAMEAYKLALADYDAEQAALGGGTNEGRRAAILAAMKAYNHPEELIESTLEELGLRDGGRVGLKHGGRIGLYQGGGPHGGSSQGNTGGTTGGNKGGWSPSVGRSKKGYLSGHPGGGTTKTNLRNVPIRKPKKNVWENLQTHFTNNQKLADAVKKGLISTEDYNVLGGIDVNKTLGLGPVTTGITSAAYNAVQSLLGNQPVSDIAGDVSRNIYGSTLGDDTTYGKQYNEIINSGVKDGGRVGAFGGGIMSNQRGLVNQPGGYAGITDIFAEASFSKPDFGGITEAIGNVEEKNELLANRQDDFFMLRQEAIMNGDRDKILEIEWDFFKEFGIKMPVAENITEESVTQMAAQGGIMGYDNGGSVLPQGIEMDYRGGGFIPMGSQERADDVPARVSKNEFVMTADAVKAAGGGNVNQGAKRMYNLMNNLEARA